VSFEAITLYVTSERVFIFVSVYFIMDSVRRLLDTLSYIIAFYVNLLKIQICCYNTLATASLNIHRDYFFLYVKDSPYLKMFKMENVDISERYTLFV
jgi:hypothetical protein